jgi:hypothetical protein
MMATPLSLSTQFECRSRPMGYGRVIADAFSFDGYSGPIRSRCLQKGRRHDADASDRRDAHRCAPPSRSCLTHVKSAVQLALSAARPTSNFLAITGAEASAPERSIRSAGWLRKVTSIRRGNARPILCDSHGLPDLDQAQLRLACQVG